jgi:galactonate dehydratase
MRIEDVEWIQAGRWLFVLVHTEAGITGLGEAGIHGYPEAIGGIMAAWRPYLVGQDPLRIEHHWQFLYRNSHFRGAVIGAALSALDIALWDLAGKHFETPAYQLLGGRCREKVRLYLHVRGETPDALAADAGRAVGDGYTAVRFNPFPRDYTHLRYDALLEAIVQRVAAVRETVGTGVDLCVELHRRMDPHHAFGLARELTAFRPYFVEDPLLPDSVQNMGALQREVEVPIATGERLHTIWEFNELLAARGCRFVRPDICLCGGLTHAKKIAALAEAYHVGVVPHNPLSPVSTAACVQLDACIPNFALQEYTGEDRPPKSTILKQPLRREGGYLIVPDAPGIGVELDLDVARSLPPAPKVFDTPLHEDGSVADR